MPHRTRRMVVAAAAAAALALPVLAASSASAATSPTYRSVHVMFHDVGKAPTLRGNTHFGDLQVNRAPDGTVTVAGQLADFDCAPGVYFHVYSFGREDTLCTRVHTWVIASSDVTLQLNPQTLAGTRLVGTLDLSSLRGDSVRTYPLDFTLTGTDPATKYVNDGFPDASSRTVTRIRPGVTSGTFGPMTLDDLKRDNQLTELRSDIIQPL